MKSISKRLTLRIMMVLLAMMGIIAGVVYFTVGEYMDDEAKHRFQIVVIRAHREIQRRLTEVYVATTNNVHEIERDIDDPDKLYDHLGRIVRQNPWVISCGLLFVPDYYLEKGKYFVPFATRDTADVVSVMRIDSVYHDYFEDDWYVARMKSDSGGWLDPYFEDSLLTPNIAPRLLTTYAVPIHNREGQPVALLCSDLSLDDMRNEMLQQVRRGKKNFEQHQKHPSYCCIIDRNGRYILHPDKERMLRDTLDANVTFKDKQGAVSATIDGVPSWLCYSNVKYIEWTVLMVAPKDLIQRHGRMLNITILTVLLIGLAAIYLFCRQQIRKVTSPLHRFARSAEEVAKGNFNAPLPDIRDDDEIRLLRDSFGNMQQSLSQYIDELKTTTAQKTSIESELAIARNIQMSMLPNAESSSLSDKLELHATMSPAKEVGGDLYEYFVRDNLLYFCIGDVAGKGVPAALVMTTVCGAFRLLAESESEPQRIVARMNDMMTRDNSFSLFITFFVGVLELETGHLCYCNAGHKAPFMLIDNSPCSTLTVKRQLPVGAMPDVAYTQQETTLAPGTTLFLYTDGLDEAENAQRQMFGKERIKEVLQTTSPKPHTLIEQMTQAVADFVGDTEQSDDLTMLALQYV